jgi:GT2 family glycosyltransferase
MSGGASATGRNGTSLPVTVVVPSWRRPEWLRRCLESVIAQRPHPMRVVVVGRKDDSATFDVAQAFGDVEWIPVTSGGHVQPLRAVQPLIETEFVAVLDDDALPRRADWLVRLYEEFDEDVACVGGHVWNVGDHRFNARKRAGQMTWYGRVLGNVARRDDSDAVSVSTVQEANWMWRTSVFSKLEFSSIWDLDDATMYGLELCLQARDAGWRIVFTPHAPVDHFLAPRDDAIPRENEVNGSFAYSRNSTFIALRHLRRRLIAYALWATFVGEEHNYGLIRAAYDVARRPETWRLVVASVRGRQAGFSAWRRERHVTDALPRPRRLNV